MGAAYGRLVDSHDGLVDAHHTTVEGGAQQVAMLLGQLGTSQAEEHGHLLGVALDRGVVGADQPIMVVNQPPVGSTHPADSRPRGRSGPRSPGCTGS